MQSTPQAEGLITAASRSHPLPTPDQQLTLQLNGRRLVRTLLGTAAVLIVVGFLGEFSTRFLPDFFGRDLLASLTYLGGETNLPATFSALLLLGAAALLGTIARIKWALQDSQRRVWTGLAFLFGVLALDEAAGLHERLIVPVQKVIKTDGVLHYAWVVPYGALTILVLLACLRFLRHLPARTRAGMLLAGVLYVGGAFGFELIEGYVKTLYGRHTFLMEGLITVKESLEMFGVILLIATLFAYIREYLPGLRVQVGLNTEAPRA
ncbi:hypothetical protein QOL99_10435 [Deinococcus sp. MIMF12]|uniref:Multidrug transporter n=1 Tax=Deinococcus rhizophilus TaxID=3049544 RepID=A0ABT7JKU0_9DEIO|nr:hypothetical protein [Deinococcus rhizophilus]MDL2344573.1 hypothetical protein [Deinococcus rhizophilus]